MARRFESFLWELCSHLLGPPEYGSSWHCPFCDPDPERKSWASFSVRPPLRHYPIKFRCHRCKVWGDEHDLLHKFFHDDEESQQFWLDYGQAFYPPELRSRRGYPDTGNAPPAPSMMSTNTKRGQRRSDRSPNGAQRED